MLRLARAASRPLVLLLAVPLGIVVLAMLAAGGLAWRMSESPLNVTALARRVLPHVAPGVSVGRVTVALERWEGGRVLRVSVADAARGQQGGPADTVHSASAALALSPLLLGEVRPEQIVAAGLRLHVRRPASGGQDGAEEARRLLSDLRRVAVTDAQVMVADVELGQEWQLSGVSLDATRRPDGSLDGRATATATVGDVSATLAAQGRYAPDAAELNATLSPVSPAALGRAVPRLDGLQALDAAVGVQADASFGPGLTLKRATVQANSGPGVAQLPAKGGGTSPAKFAAMSLDAEVTATHATLRGLRLVLAPPSGAPPTTLVVAGDADRAGGRFQARITVDMDRAAFADLPVLWPPGVGGNARAWLTENITVGTAHDGHAAVTLVGSETGADIDMTAASGSLTGDDVTVWWLRPVPPLDHGRAVLTWQNPDTVQIAVPTARQGALAVSGGSVRITGLTGKDQVAAIEADVAGGLADLLTLLRHPRLRLLSRHPVPFTSAAGAVAAHLSVQVPLDSKVTVDQIGIHGSGQVSRARLAGLVAGRDLDQGELAFDVTNDGLHVTGPAQLDHMPGTLALEMDFRAGPPGQVLEHATATLRVGPRDARAAGLEAIGLDSGTIAATIDYAERRDGNATIRLNADLRDAGFQTPLGWSKAAGRAGHLEGRALLLNGKLVGLDDLRAEAPGLSIRARSEMVGGKPSVIHLERGEIGRSSATGTITLPQHEDDAYRVTLAGPRLDLTGRAGSMRDASPRARPSARAGSGTPYAIDLRFQEVLFGRGHALGPVSLTAHGAGHRLGAARLVTGGPEHVQADLVDGGPERRLWATADNLGVLLQKTGLAREIDGGALILDGTFDDRLPNSPFNGTAELRNFKVRGAPIVGKILQGMTLYGLVDALSGPGLAFDRLYAPFRLDDSVIELQEARAYSSSLGVTADGRMDFDRSRVDLKGTIVPAYFFNALPGKIPLLGRLFSPEKGSGVFAATYALTGSMTSPNVAINPLSTLTPGFTRRLFDLFK